MAMLRDFFAGWSEGFKTVGHSFTKIINAVFLTFAYVVGVVITACVARIVGKRFLDMDVEPTRQSYWSDHVLKTEPLKKYERQF